MNAQFWTPMNSYRKVKFGCWQRILNVKDSLKIHAKQQSRDTEVDVLERFHRNLSRVTLRGDGTQVDDADEVVKEMGGRSIPGIVSG